MAGRSRSAFLLGLAATGLLVAGCISDSSIPLGAQNQSILNGQETFERPEIGAITVGGASCTATLISPNVVITAAHCVAYQTWLEPGLYGSFMIQHNATTSFSYSVDRYRVFGFTTAPTGHDIALAHIHPPVPPEVATPLSLAFSEPNIGETVTQYGYGCTDTQTQEGGGVKRKFPYTWKTPPMHIGCPGDSGGPTIADSSSQIFLITSAISANDYDANAPISIIRSDILDQMNQFDGIVNCGQFADQFSCNAQSAECHWQDCIQRCMPRGTPSQVVCHRCFQHSTMDDCNTEMGTCAWYMNANICAPTGTDPSTFEGPLTGPCTAYPGMKSCSGLTGYHCSWYLCSSTCRATGTPQPEVCPPNCLQYQSLESCNANSNGRCAWYGCAGACLQRGTPNDHACNSGGSGLCRLYQYRDVCVFHSSDCSWFDCSQSCWPNGTSQDQACPPTTDGMVSGVVFQDEGFGFIGSNTLLPGASVVVAGNTITASAKNALWSLRLQPGTFQIIASFAGYLPNSISCDVLANDEALCPIGLQIDLSQSDSGTDDGDGGSSGDDGQGKDAGGDTGKVDAGHTDDGPNQDPDLHIPDQDDLEGGCNCSQRSTSFDWTVLLVTLAWILSRHSRKFLGS